jgi:DNA-binding MarR family transcriptional regulator
MPTTTSGLREELKQTRPFHSPAHEAVVSILRTAALLQRQLALVVERGGVSLQQYNVLRILRGAGEEGLPTLAIRDRMIEEAAGITRLLDKLERGGYVVRERCTPDRRQVLCRITPAGTAVLAKLDQPVNALNDAALSTLGAPDQARLIELLAAVRASCAGQGSSPAQGDGRLGHPPR